MTDIWYQCEECIFGSNSNKAATKHVDDSGHQVNSEEDPS